MSNLNEIFEKAAEFLKNEANTETIIGKPFQLGEYTCVPVMSVGMGIGGGQGEGNEKEKGQGMGAGGGAGIGLTPLGFLATKDSSIQFVAARQAKVLDAVFDRLPGLLEKFLTKKAEKSA